MSYNTRSPSKPRPEETLPDIPPAIDRLVEQLATQAQVTRVILFGSRARGDHATRSDVDLAVDATTADSQIWQQVLDLVERAETLLPIDLVWLPEASPEIRHEIEREGIMLFERPGSGPCQPSS
jgi:predicted nucleotidyltransferase